MLVRLHALKVGSVEVWSRSEVAHGGTRLRAKIPSTEMRIELGLLESTTSADRLEDLTNRRNQQLGSFTPSGYSELNDSISILTPDEGTVS